MQVLKASNEKDPIETYSLMLFLEWRFFQTNISFSNKEGRSKLLINSFLLYIQAFEGQF
jgi:hypothetical protein